MSLHAPAGTGEPEVAGEFAIAPLASSPVIEAELPPVLGERLRDFTDPLQRAAAEA
ncbi:MAG: hypothetical protein JSR26_04090 [Proteobacteria bacterium]|nr:hypothetical protein [Pseudomonadota bacterium]